MNLKNINKKHEVSEKVYNEVNYLLKKRYNFNIEEKGYFVICYENHYTLYLYNNPIWCINK